MLSSKYLSSIFTGGGFNMWTMVFIAYYAAKLFPMTNIQVCYLLNRAMLVNLKHLAFPFDCNTIASSYIYRYKH